MVSGKEGVQTEGSKLGAESEESALAIQLLGGFAVRSGGQVVVDQRWHRRKSQALLKLLALNKGRWLHREQVLDTLWPDLDPQAAAANLRKNLHYLRGAFSEHGLASPVVSAAADMLALSPEVWIDFEAFKNQAKAACASRTDPVLYEEALALYAGDLLPDEPYEEWTEPQREELRSLRNQLLFELAQLYEAMDQSDRARERLQQLLQTEPSQEEAHRALMRLFARAGDRRKALRQYEKCREVLERDLGAVPSDETQALHRLISEGRLRAPATPSMPGGGAYVGRERELHELRAAVDEAVSGRGRLALLAGEPGIGKTRTAEELSVYARLRGAEPLWGRCYESEGAPAYWPWVQIIRAYVEGREAEELRRDMGAGAADIAQIVPEVREALPDLPQATGLESEQARFRLFDTIARFLASASRHQPLFLVLEDLHWADKPSLLLLEFLSREIKGSPLMILGTYRDVEVGPGHPFAQTLGELSRGHPTSRLQLTGLEEANVARFIEIASTVEPPAALVSTVHRETEGNPFFVKEIVHLLAAEGKLVAAQQDASWKLSIPQGVRDVIGRRVGRISEACRNTLTVAAVIGRDFGLNVLERIAELRDDHVLESLDEAVAAHLIDESPGALGAFRFAHALIRETLYDQLSMTRRVRLHRDVAEAIEQAHAAALDLHLAELAHHFFQAIPGGEADKAVDYARRAGDRALALLAYEEAARLHETALKALEMKIEPDELLRCELLLALGDAQSRSGDMPSAHERFRQTIEIARRMGAGEQLARAALGYGGRFVWGGHKRQLIPQLEEALTVLPGEDSALRVRLLSRLAGAYTRFDPTRASALSLEAVEVARRLGDPVSLCQALDACFWTNYSPDNVDERLALAGEMVGAAEKIGDHEASYQAHQWRMLALLELGNIEEADREIAAQVRAAEELRQPPQLWDVEMIKAMRAMLEGRFNDAELLAKRHLDMGREIDRGTAMVNFFVQTSTLNGMKGTITGEMVDSLRSSSDQIGGPWRPAFANIYARIGRPSEARRELDALDANDFDGLHKDFRWLLEVTLVSEASAIIDDTRRAALLYRMLIPYGHLNPTAGPTACYGSASRHLGLLATTLGRWKEASRHFEDALEMNERMGARPWVAWTQHDYATMLLGRDQPGDREKAQALAHQALETTREIGMKGLEEKLLSLPLPEAAPAPGGLRTIVFTDVEGSTALTEGLGDEKARELLREHERITREALKAHGGAEIKSLGDGFMASFGSAAGAVECALAIQEAACDLPIRLRIGLNAGEPIAEAEDLYGTAVNAAARIASQAKGGEILVSDVVRQLVAGKGFAFVDQGETALKGFDEPVRLYQVEGPSAAS